LDLLKAIAMSNEDALEQNNEADSTRETHEPRKRSISKGLAVLGLLLLGLVLIAPNLIGWTGQLQTAVDRFVHLDGQLQIGSSSLGWFQKVRLKNILLKNTEGEIIAKIEEIESSKSLLMLCLNQQDLGEFTVRQADVSLVTWPAGSNLEQVFQPMISTPQEGEPGKSSLPQVTLNLTNSRLSFKRLEDDQWYDLVDTAAKLEVLPASNQLTLKLQATNGGDVSGSIQVDANASMDFATSTLSDLKAHVNAQQFVCDFLTPILHRIGQDTQLRAKLDSRLDATWQNDGKLSLEIEQLRLSQLQIDSPTFLAENPVRLKELFASGDIQQSTLAFSAKQFALKSDFALLDFEGQADINQLINAVSGKANIENDFALHAMIDLAAMAEAVPALMSIKDDVVLNEAKLSCEAFSRMEQGQRRLLMNVEVPVINGQKYAVSVRGDRRSVDRSNSTPFQWRNPLRITAAARQVPKTPLWLELLTCESDFLVANGRTEADGRGQLTLNGDLNLLQRRLEQFVDLSETRLSGIVAGKFDWSKSAADRNQNASVYQLTGGASISDLHVRMGEQPAWREEQLVINLGANQMVNSKSSLLQAAGLEIISAADRATLTLTKPVRDPGLESQFDCNLALVGDLGNWMRRVKAFVYLPEMHLKGNLNTLGSLSINPESLSIKTESLAVQDLQLIMSGMRVRERTVQGDVALKYLWQDQTLTSTRIFIRGEAMQMNADQFVVDLRDNAELLNATFTLAADMRRGMSWFDSTSNDSPYRGKLSGKLIVRMTGAKTDLEVDSMVDNFSYVSISNPPKTGNQASAPIESPMWTEQRLRLAGSATYNSKNDSLVVSKIKLNSDAVSADLKGRITDLSTLCRLNLIGKLQTDSAKLAKHLKDNLGIDLVLSGNDESNVAIQGAVFEPTANDAVVSSDSPNGNAIVATADPLTVRGQVRWESGQIYGVAFGPSKIAVHYDPTQLDIEPINLKLEQGRLTADPAIVFGDPMVMTIKQDKILNRANLSPEVCRGWMKYVAPMLAEATEATGNFSVVLKQDAFLPLTDPLNGALDCEISLHTAEVGPGPLGQTIVGIAEKVRAIAQGQSIGETLLSVAGNPNSAANQKQQVWISMPEQKVGCRMENGRVYHDRMTFQVKDVVIQTSGSVGADQSIDMVATIPIRDEWLAKNKYVKALAGSDKVVTIPIRGTITKPQFVMESLASLPKLLLQGAANNLIKEQTSKILQDSGGKLLGQEAENLLKGIQNSNGVKQKPLEDAAGQLLEDQLRKGLNRFIPQPGSPPR
jgi:hypothetical protein